MGEVGSGRCTSARGNSPWVCPSARGGWHDLIESLVRGNHAEVTACTLFERIKAGLEVTDFGAELPVAFLELLIVIALRSNGLLESIQLAYAILGEPNPVLQEENDEC
jgi:hypothetical protein